MKQKWHIYRKKYQKKYCICFLFVYNKSRNSNVPDERASLKVGLQVEQGNFPQRIDVKNGHCG